MNKKDNIFYFFLLALCIHLSFFLINKKRVSEDVPVLMNTNSAPLAINIKTSFTKREKIISAEKEIALANKSENKPVLEKIEKPKKKILEPDIKSKLKNSKKEVETRKKNIEKIETKSSKEIKKDKLLTIEQNSIDNNYQIDFGRNFSIETDGILVAESSDGIQYKILKQIEPNYPVQAKKVRYKNKVTVSVRFLVGLNGSIEKIDIIKSHKKLGFDDEVLKALKQWKFNPIYYKNKNIKVFFTKEFIFEYN
ncbi:transport protein TonB [Fusobacterium necrogenes]|uniref:Transport protein TonB n=1 Tax=Fusobacterium necrogenes TaxID=858 RepID=A0A377GWN7_9FUSO|nr:TonB family protein [Fusobacterium necrogenes]STO31410.1 transport protein TonB [Fusobacterium necrogenes]